MFDRVLIIEPPRWKGKMVVRGSRCSRLAIFNETPFPYPTASTAGFLRAAGIEVAHLDANALNLGWSAIEKKIREFAPQLALFNAASCTISFDLETAALCKKVSPEITTAVYEPILSPMNPEKIFGQSPQLDFIYGGEPDFITLDLCRSGKEADGLIFRENGAIRRNETRANDISRLPAPAYDLLPMEKYTEYTIRTHRGCPFKCIFCSMGSPLEGTALQKQVRFRNTDVILADLKQLLKYTRMINFGDETFTVNRARTLELFSKIREEELRFSFTCGTRLDRVDPELLKALKDGGCVSIAYGIESGDDEILKLNLKGITTEQMREGFRMTREAGIPTHAFVIIGLKGETRQTARKTIEFLKEVRPDGFQLATATPMIGTLFWSYCKENSYITGGDIEAERAMVGTHALIETEHLKRRDLYRLVMRTLLEMNLAYFRDTPPGFAAKALFAIKRLRHFVRIAMLPFSYHPGKIQLWR